MIAGQQRTTYYCVPGGQAPLPPGEAYLDLNVRSGPLDPRAEEPQNTAYPPAAFPPPTYVPDLPTDHRLDTATATELAAGRQ